MYGLTLQVAGAPSALPTR